MRVEGRGTVYPGAETAREPVAWPRTSSSQDALWNHVEPVAGRPAREWAAVQRLLVMRLDNIGDVVMCGPVLRTLRAALPHAHITMMVTPGGSQVTPLLPWVDDVIVRRVVWQDISGAWPFDPLGELQLVDELRRRNFDAAVILTSFSQSPYPPAYVAYLAGIPLRIAQSREFAGGVVSHWVKPLPDDTHQVDRNLHLLEAVGFPIAGRELELRIPPEVQASADRLLQQGGISPGQPFVAIAPGASAEARRYDPGRYGAVARQLAQEVHPVTGQPLTVVLLGSPRETALVEPLAGADGGQGVGGGIVSLAGQTSVPEMAAVINRASLLIGNNSGPLHMADALGRPMVILYSGTEYESQWRPRSAPARLLRRSTFCTPCFAFRCRFRMECLDIAPETVEQEARAMLALDAAGSAAPPQTVGRGRAVTEQAGASESTGKDGGGPLRPAEGQDASRSGTSAGPARVPVRPD